MGFGTSRDDYMYIYIYVGAAVVWALEPLGMTICIYICWCCCGVGFGTSSNDYMYIYMLVLLWCGLWNL